ncbi:hypothetical protein P691DRAFT_767592 [Macrolepiota fuliginosa MF-IS2]|uniref:Uncharacterized protein n=1 Tax=Macrolepiota fuliginosa MF-IS2 TaxID=1400762 RepID=A0A9P5WZ77_9AGAR|nr:hypothetical protein P691DRAFT_767592 [Macrolepiota fuliginosa MF-IS2]
MINHVKHNHFVPYERAGNPIPACTRVTNDKGHQPKYQASATRQLAKFRSSLGSCKYSSPESSLATAFPKHAYTVWALLLVINTANTLPYAKPINNTTQLTPLELNMSLLDLSCNGPVAIGPIPQPNRPTMTPASPTFSEGSSQTPKFLPSFDIDMNVLAPQVFDNIVTNNWLVMTPNTWLSDWG